MTQGHSTTYPSLSALRDKIIAIGIASVHKHEIRPEKIRGCLAGFELCRVLETPADYQECLRQRHEQETRMHREQVDAEEYWEYRCATAQVEHLWERLRIIWGIGDSFSSMAYMHLGDLAKELLEGDCHATP